MVRAHATVLRFVSAHLEEFVSDLGLEDSGKVVAAIEPSLIPMERDQERGGIRNRGQASEWGGGVGLARDCVSVDPSFLGSAAPLPPGPGLGRVGAATQPGRPQQLHPGLGLQQTEGAAHMMSTSRIVEWKRWLR